MRKYELMLVIQPELDGITRDELMTKIEGMIISASVGEEKPVVNSWGRRNLAYPIKDHKDGYYFLFDVAFEPSAISNLERTLLFEENVLRHIVVRKDS